jgi:hypothetical protein
MRPSRLVLLLKRRSLLFSLLVVSPLVMFILGLAACVKHPVGDPEKSKVDPQFAGVWWSEEPDGHGTLLVMRPYDSRTYFAKVLSYRATDQGVEATNQLDCKAWLTAIGGTTFLTMEPLGCGHLAGLSEKPPYLVGKISLAEGALHLQLVDGGKEPARSASSSRELETAIAERVDSAALYVDEAESFKKAGDKALIERVLTAFHLDS